MIGNRYGYRPLQPEVEATEFELLLSLVEELELPGLDLLRDWYQRDDNAVPPQYALQVQCNRILKSIIGPWGM